MSFFHLIWEGFNLLSNPIAIAIVVMRNISFLSMKIDYLKNYLFMIIVQKLVRGETNLYQLINY